MNTLAITGLLNLAVQAINAARAVRDIAKEEFPGETFPTDQELIQKFLTEAQLLDEEAGELREWLKTL